MNKPLAKNRFLLLSVLLLSLSISLYFIVRPGSETTNPVSLSFYSWKNRFSLDSNQYALLKEYNVDHLRVKLLELSWQEYPAKVKVNNRIYSDSYNNYSSDYFLEHKLTPVIFIENNIFYKIDSAGIREMASLAKRALKIHAVELVFYQEKIWNNYWENLYFTLGVEQESTDSLNLLYDKFRKNIISYEFDCDWTEKTRDKYFYFLENMRDSLQRKTEATLRLHQYKYRDKTGIPPVDAVNLMCYNMGEFKNVQESNSIFNKKILKEYMVGQELYPLPMNIALPSFSWVVVFRNNRFYKLIPESLVTENVFTDSSCCVKKLGVNKYEVQTELRYSWMEEALQPGDKVRLETVEGKELVEAYRYLCNDLGLIIPELIIFDLNNTTKKDKFDDLAKNLIIK